MSYPIFLKLQPKQAPTLKQTQKIIMLPQMQQALHLLQMPVMELSMALNEEMEKNPLLETDVEPIEIEQNETEEEKDLTEQEMNFDEKNFEILRQLDEDFKDHFLESGNFIKKRTSEDEKLKAFQDSLVCEDISLFEHLMKQAKETFENKEKLNMATCLIGNFDERGFLSTPLLEIAYLSQASEENLKEILKEIQTFEPYGVGATSVQECLLIQLRCLRKEHSLAYSLLENCFDDLLHNRLPVMQKTLGCTKEDLLEAIDKIAKLDLHPGFWYVNQVVQHIVPDVTLRQDGENLIAEVDNDIIPQIKLNKRYLRMLDDEKIPIETKTFIKQNLMSAKWLIKNILQRNDTIIRIAEFLAKTQREFFIDPKGNLIPMTMKVVAEELDLHESTIARAVANKYINSPRGIFPLRSFFTNAYITNSGEDISSKTVKDGLEKLIQSENKKKPLSDDALSDALKQDGISCARRTISKYRAQLNIGNASQRKKY